MPEGGGTLRPQARLAQELGDLKRLRDASSPDSIATRLFRAAWGALSAGEPVEGVAHRVTAEALAACRLGGIGRSVLARVGLAPADAAAVLCRGFDEVAAPVLAPLRDRLRAALAGPSPAAGVAPFFVDALARQPRAGATRPGRPRIVLEPPESHAEHCLVVAALGVVLCGPYEADPRPVFLAGLAHHLHNAVLPDSGYAGEMLLGAHLGPVMRRLFEEGLAALPPTPAGQTRAALALTGDAGTPEGRAFHAADVIDRVLQMHHYARVAAFTASQALDEMELVHAGPVQAFHQAVLHAAGLL